jgi:hypothetical protein
VTRRDASEGGLGRERALAGRHCPPRRADALVSLRVPKERPSERLWIRRGGPGAGKHGRMDGSTGLVDRREGSAARWPSGPSRNPDGASSRRRRHAGAASSRVCAQRPGLSPRPRYSPAPICPAGAERVRAIVARDRQNVLFLGAVVEIEKAGPFQILGRRRPFALATETVRLPSNSSGLSCFSWDRRFPAGWSTIRFERKAGGWK